MLRLREMDLSLVLLVGGDPCFLDCDWATDLWTSHFFFHFFFFFFFFFFFKGVFYCFPLHPPKKV